MPLGNSDAERFIAQAFEGFDLRKAIVEGFKAGKGNPLALKKAFVLFIHQYADKELDKSSIPKFLLNQIRPNILEWIDTLMERLFDDLTRV